MAIQIKIKKNEEKPESTELLAANIIKVAEGMEKLLNGELNERAIIVLLQAGIGTGNISQAQIKLVLNSLPKLKGWYIRK
jgi:hypothetical protein